MSHVKDKSILGRIGSTRSVKSLAANFLRGTMAGQKLFLYNEKLPRVINVSFIEKTCMFACKMCPYAEQTVRDMYKDGSEMSFETLKNLVASVPDDSYYTFDISAIGETLLFKPLPDFIKYMKQQRPRVNVTISTNALPLTEDRFRALVESGLDTIQLSLYAENAEDHKAITQSTQFHRVCENIRAASRIRKEMGSKTPFMQVFMMGAKETEDTEARFIEYWTQYVDESFIRPIYNLGREIEGMTPTFEDTPSEKRYPCIMPWYSTAIRSNGDVLACYMFHWHEETYKKPVGNINEQSLEEIWASREFRKFREAHLNLDLEDYPVCQKCNLWQAYTNVWEEGPDGKFSYNRVRIKDFLARAPEQRGG